MHPGEELTPRKRLQEVKNLYYNEFLESYHSIIQHQNNSLLQFKSGSKTRPMTSMTRKCRRATFEKQTDLEILKILSRVMPLQRNYHGPFLILSVGSCPGSIRVDVLEFLKWFHTLEKWLEEESLQCFEVKLEERVQLKKQLTVTGLVLASQVPETIEGFQKFLLNLLAGSQRFVGI